MVSVAADTPKGFRSSKPHLQLDQAAPGSAGHGFGAADDVHLGEDRFHVRFHGAFADEQCGADFLVAFSLGHQLEHVDFARAQRFTADAFRELGGEMNGNTCFTRVHPTDTVHQRFARHVLEEITFRPGLNGALNIFVTVEGCKHDDPRVLIVLPNFFDCADTVELGHP